MIGQLRGNLLKKQAPKLLIDVNGVGYEVDAPMSTFYQLPVIGSEVTLHTHLAVREDAHTLYGFATEGERALFRSLIKVNGVGAKLALTILSGMSVNEFVECVHGNDAVSLTRMPGVGKKTAERLIVEMRDRLTENMSEIVPIAGDKVKNEGSIGNESANPVSDAVSALISLGYKAHDASRMVRSVDTANKDSEEIIRRALQAVVVK